MTGRPHEPRAQADGPGPAPDDVQWLGAPTTRDPQTVGGKAAQLSRLYDAMPVPAGFCVPAEAVRRTVGADGAPDRSRLRLWLAAGYEALEARIGRRDPAVAVRSSGLAEDGRARSFAGQYVTVLGARGIDDVVEAALRCCRSLRSERVARYQDGDVDLEGRGMAVLVQELIEADASAVVFSVDPVSGNPDEIVINASWGLGDAVVDGAVTPDAYRVARTDHGSVRREIGDKDVMTVLDRNGVASVAVPPDRRRASCLDDAQCGALAAMAVEAERRTGWPVDLECAVRGSETFLLQCRPITTL